jgi:60S ribosome subunit biogenesis protein NIP7
MRVLTDEETKVFFKKLSEYIGENIKFLIDRSDEPYVFRLIKDRIYYMSEALMKLASNVARDNLVQ